MIQVFNKHTKKTKGMIMSLLKIVKPEKATGDVKNAYDQMQAAAGMVPLPLQMYSISPPHLNGVMQSMEYYMNHPTLNPVLLAQIRLMAADRCDHPYCVEFNSSMLKNFAGLNEQQIADFMGDPTSISTTEKDKALLAFVSKAMKDPDSTEAGEIEQLKGLGWTDQDIYDAMSMAANMVTSSILFRAFKIGE